MLLTSLTSLLMNLFGFAPVCATVIENAIMSLKNKINKIYTFSVEALKTIKSLVSAILAHIINMSFSTGCFPNSLKKSRAVPIYKTGSKSDVNNYRPTSNLLTFSKIFEKIVCSQLFSYFEHFKLFRANQFGFTKMFRHLTHSFTHCNTFTIILIVVIPLHQYS